MRLRFRPIPRRGPDARPARGVCQAFSVSVDEKNIASIARIQLGYLEKRLAHMDMALVVDDAALLELAKDGFDPVFGARPLKRAIQQQIENPLASEILKGSFGNGDVVKVDAEGGKLVFAAG